MYRDLLVHVDGSQSGRLRVQFAVGLAAQMGARLSGLHVTPVADVPPIRKPSRVPEMVAALCSELALDAQVAETIFNEEAMRRSPDACWLEASGDVVQGITDKARYADLVILGQHESQGPAERHPLPIAHSVVLECGRPVLVVPVVVQRTPLERIAVAWDGSREAVRAVHDALPLLRQAQSIRIVTMIRNAADNNDDDARILLAHLCNHGIRVGMDVLQVVTTLEEHKSLQEQIDQGSYDLLVMGGYSHPMWQEFIFGGATRSILTSSKISVLVSH
jgi:nucleotide-binding universal stress UspA family protein